MIPGVITIRALILLIRKDQQVSQHQIALVY